MKADKRFLQGALFGALIMLFIGMAGIFLPNVFVHALGSDELKNKIQEAEQVSEKKLKKIQDMMSQYYLYSDDIEEEQLEDAIYTGFVSAIIIILLSAYFIVYGFNWVYLLIALIVCAFLMFYAPRLYAKTLKRKIENRIIE